MIKHDGGVGGNSNLPSCLASNTRIGWLGYNKIEGVLVLFEKMSRKTRVRKCQHYKFAYCFLAFFGEWFWFFIKTHPVYFDNI